MAMAFSSQSPQPLSLDLHHHFCKLRKALSCSTCHQLLQNPACLQCNHHFCMSCLLHAIEDISACPTCMQPAATNNAKHSPDMHNLVEIYKSLASAAGLGLCFPEMATPTNANHDRRSQVDKLAEPKDWVPKVKVEDECVSPGTAIKGQRRYKVRDRGSATIMDTNEADGRKRDASSIEVPCRGILPAPKRIKLPCPPEPTYVVVSEGAQMTSSTGTTSDDVSMDVDATAQVRCKKPACGHATRGIARSAMFPEDNFQVDYEHVHEGHPSPIPSNRNIDASLKSKEPVQGRINIGPDSGQNDPPNHGEPGGPQLEGSIIQEDQQGEQATCAFCHKPDNSEVAGPLIHYKGGVPVSGSKRSGKVFSVHKNCAEWAPGVYFDDDVAKNVPKEIARGHRIKCHVCGLRGAVLGCYVKRCRKSFHYPCAHTQSCRWDGVNFLVFCPEHVNSRFPGETPRESSMKPVRGHEPAHTEEEARQGNECQFQSANLTPSQCVMAEMSIEQPSRSVKAEVSIEPSSQSLKVEMLVEPHTRRLPTSKFVLCGSGLSPKANELVAKFVRHAGVSYEKTWTPSVTHVIAGTDEVGAARRTFKYLMATLEGRWIVRIDWLSACMEAGDYVSEVPYEINLDIQGLVGGPRCARGMAVAKANGLFEGLSFYLLGEYADSYRLDLEALVTAGRGVILTRMPEAADTHNQASIVMIYSKDMYPDMLACQREELNKARYLEAKSFAGMLGVKVAGHTWILDSVAAYKLQPFE